MAKKEIAVKKYVVKLSAEERKRLEALIRAGKSSARVLDRARILLRADVSEAGEGWSDSASRRRSTLLVDDVARSVGSWSRRVRVDAQPQVRSRLYRPRIFDGAAEAKLIALACSPAAEGFARWSLRLLEEEVVDPDIVEKASDNTIGRTY